MRRWLKDARMAVGAENKPMAPFSISFRFKYPGVCPSVGCYHIHAPEHIATTHRLGAPGFVIDRVKPPKGAAARRSIEFDCRTLNTPMRVFMHRRSAYDSELTFTLVTRPRPPLPLALAPVLAAHSAHLLPALLPMPMPPPMNRAFLRLLFEVFPHSGSSSGHDLGVTFTFWNPLIYFMVPFFPVFVAINGIEDMFYLRHLQEHGIPEGCGTWFDIYRRP